MTETERVLRFLEEAADRAVGESDDVEPPSEAETLSETRRNLETALVHAHAGGDIPAEARLRGVKKAVVTGFRPVTSHQRVFNVHTLGAVENLARATEALAANLAYQDTRTKRLQASNATTNLTVDDLAAQIEDLSSRVENTERVIAIEERLDRISDQLAAVAARQNLI